MQSANDASEKYKALKAENESLKFQNEKLSERADALAAQVKWFQKQLFGSKSERRIADTPKEQLFLGEQFQQETAEPETRTVAAHQRKKRKSQSVDGASRSCFSTRQFRWKRSMSRILK